jgi:serine protease
VSLFALAGTGAGAASAHMIKMPTLLKAIQEQKGERAVKGTPRPIYPKAPPCPESGLLPQIPGAPVEFSNCGLPEFPATTLPTLGPMAYWGGFVQTHPQEFIVYWGWGQSGAFPGQTCSSESFDDGGITTDLPCDPDGAGKYIADFVSQAGGTNWADVQNQYFQTDSSGAQQYINENRQLLAGTWVDDTDPANLAKTSATNPATGGSDPNGQPSTNTYTDMAIEASRAVQHFESTGQLNPANIQNANIILAQAPAFSDPNALNEGYCAFHDYTDTKSPGNTYYENPLVQQGIQYTNLPYQLAINVGSENVCGENYVNSGPRGKLDGFSIVLGH